MDTWNPPFEPAPNAARRSSAGDSVSTHVRTGPEATARLRQLGFTPPSIVRDALEYAGGTARFVTPWHPAGYSGTKMWAETTFALSWLGREGGWEHEAVKGVELVTNHRTAVAVIVTAGNAATGFENYRPETRYERPEMVQAIVNGTLDRLWDPERERSDWQIWFLLHNIASNQGPVQAELSLPASIGPGGQVTRWIERLLIPRSEDGGGTRMPVAEPDTPPEPVVTVRRRAG